MSDVFGFDAYSPNQIADRVRSVGVAKARLALPAMFVLSFLAGAFIGLGAMFYVLVVSDPTLGFAAGRVLGGVCFSLGLMLVVVAGAELFTGNNLLAMAWADGQITSCELLRNWTVVATGNLMGAMALALIVFLARHPSLNQGLIAEQYLKIAAAKCALPFWTAFFRGVLCNVLVCLAVWMSLAGRSVIDKAVAVIFPITAFVAAGFEHSVANMYLIPLAILLEPKAPAQLDTAVGWAGFAANLLPVMLGNLLGGSVLVGLVYQVVYRRSGLQSGQGQVCREEKPSR